MIELTEEQKTKLLELKSNFSSVHHSIENVKTKMDELNQEAESLVKTLSALRIEEKKFLNDLESEFGKGKLDPFKMTYEKEI